MAEQDHPIELEWYVAGSLESDEARKVKAHVESCAKCRAEIELLASVRDGLRATRSPEHVSPADLVAFAEEREADLSVEREKIQSHLALCETCREEIEILGSVPLVLPFPTIDEETITGGPNPWKSAFFAAAALLVVAIVGIGVTRLPVESSVEGLVPVLLAPPQRGEGPLPVLEGRGPWVVSVLLPYSAPAGNYRVRIVADEGTVVDREVIADDDNLALLIRHLRQAGEYELELTPAAADSETYRYPFVLDPAPED